MTELMAKVQNKDGLLVVSSRIIAEQLNKRHSDVLAQLESIISENENVRSLIISSSYKVESQNREYKEFLLTEKGFTIYMFNVQGHNDFKLSYIDEFERMKNALNTTIKVPTNFKEALLLALEQQEIIEKQQEQIEYQKPKVEFYDEIIDSKDTIDIGQLAKTLNVKNIGRNKLFEILREKSILDRRNQPYQTYIDRGYFKTICQK
jgi:Rha family phage regulatory protein